MGKVEAEKRSHAIFWGNMQWPYPRRRGLAPAMLFSAPGFVRYPCRRWAAANVRHNVDPPGELSSLKIVLSVARSHAASGLSTNGKENGENGTPLMLSHRTASVEAILRMVQVRLGGSCSADVIPYQDKCDDCRSSCVVMFETCSAMFEGTGTRQNAQWNGRASQNAVLVACNDVLMHCSRCEEMWGSSLSAMPTCSQERISNGPVLSRTSSSSSSMGGAGPSSSSLQLQLVDDPIPGGFQAAAQSQPLKRLDFVRTQGGFWLTWVRFGIPQRTAVGQFANQR